MLPWFTDKSRSMFVSTAWQTKTITPSLRTCETEESIVSVLVLWQWSHPLAPGDPALVNIGSDQHRETWPNKSLSQGLLSHKPGAIITLQRLTVDTTWFSQRFVPKARGWKNAQTRHQKLTQFDRTAECLIHPVTASASSPRPEYHRN